MASPALPPGCTLEVVEDIDATGLVAPLIALRWRAWRALDGDLGESPSTLDLSASDRGALHWLVSRDGQLIAAARLQLIDDPAPPASPYLEQLLRNVRPAGLVPPGRLAYLSRLVVEPAWQRRGIGGYLVAHRMQYAAERGAVGGVLTLKRTPVIEGRARDGWRTVAHMPAEFPRAGVPEQTHILFKALGPA
ncbi:MAG: GNAT family N-acetyltransferase [Alphaproteobacteria bacterium]|nr:GNAT family N-acetyltransferase [Alphaproteobacteria bacterium]MCB9791166.1 GNAT family N-acetyltransferase [Alphaproteobacteria bacterium]